MLSRLVNGVFSVTGAAGFSQAPGFLVQYQQQLAGRLAQVTDDLSALTDAAQRLGMTAEAFLALADQEQGVYSAALIAGARQALNDQAALQAAYDALAAAPAATRGLTFLQYLDEAVVRDTLANFAPVVPLTLEGLLYAGAGLLVGVGLFALLDSAARRTWQGIFPRPQQKT